MTALTTTAADKQRRVVVYWWSQTPQKWLNQAVLQGFGVCMLKTLMPLGQRKPAWLRCPSC